MNNAYDCQVWDSVTHEWTRCMVEAPEPPAPADGEQIAAFGNELQERVSIAMDEDPGAWILTDCHRLSAAGETVFMIQLRALVGDDISVIMAVETTAE